jgi:FkbM family methyltransferase
LEHTTFGVAFEGVTSDFIQQRLYLFGIWEPNLTHWITNRLKSGDTFIDVGANIGYYTLLASRLVKEGAVWAIEASPAIHKDLCHHLELNGATNVRTVNAALASKRERVQLFQRWEHNPGATTMFAEPESKLMAETDAIPLTDLLSPEEFAKVRMIKIDVEGAEWSVAQGMASLLSHAAPDLELLVEASPQRGGYESSSLIKAFTDHGFNAYRLDNDYSYRAYASPKPRRLSVLDPDLRSETEIVFSRANLTGVQVTN